MPSSSTRQDLLAMIAMTEDAIAWCQAEGEDHTRQSEMLVTYRERLAALGGFEGVTYTVPDGRGTGTPVALTDRPAAGTRAANQFGQFQVRYASVKQTNYIKSLLERKDLRPLDGDITLNVARLRTQVAANQVNGKAASAIIDRLLALPDLAPAATGPGFGRTSAVQRPASEKQTGLIGRLAAERFWFDGEQMALAVTSQSHAGWTVRLVLEGIPVESRDASAAIDYLFGCAKRREPVANVALDKSHTGPWIKADLSVYRVYFGRQSGQMLAKVWVPGLNPRTTADGVEVSGDWEYAGKADRFIDPARDHKMTRDEAAAWGQNSANCCVCGADLDDPTSIDRGIGPVCWGKMA